MSTIDEVFATISNESVTSNIDEVLIIDPNTRQINLPGSELIFGVESDTHSERKYFQCPRYVGNNIDLGSCFIRVNYRNANGQVDSYLVEDVVATNDAITFSWVLSRKVTQYKGQVRFVVCACRPGETAVEWNTTLATGMVLEGVEPNVDGVVIETNDVVAQLIAMVERQTDAVEAEGTAQIERVTASAEATETAVLAEIEAKGANTLSSIPNDYTALGNAVDALSRTRAPGIICEAEGETIVVSDASDMAVQNLRVFGKSTQDGVPTPDAPVGIKSVENPTVTVCGKNLLNLDSLIDDNFNKNPDGSYTLTKTGVGDQRFSAKADLRLPKGTYTLSIGALSGTDTAARFVFTHEDGREVTHFVTPTAPKTITITDNVKKVSAYLSTSLADGAYVTMKDVMLEVGDKTTTYEPYKVTRTIPTTHTLHGIPVTSGGNYTDSDGQQWICDEIDFERGVCIKRIGVIDSYDGEEISTLFVSSTGQLSVGSEVLYVEDNLIETPLTETEISTFRNLHTNKPHTTILNDKGAHMNAEYVADTKTYIDNKLTSLLI